ncbi:MAG: hypothetical protein INR65_16365, partial [Gluconacetobacter diazotrophicus]|nr:hypothetical protein [Gluconacetobacter diazotrophicus]
MSAFARLWRRAPAWRVCVITGVAFAGLAAMFPPTLPRFATGGLGGGTSSPAGGARFHPRPDPAPANYSGGRLIPDGAVRSGVIRVAGHDVPLPAGNWRSVGVAREGGADQLQIDVLARIENASLTGLMLIVAPTAMSGVAGPVGEPPPCADPGKLG